MKNTISRNGLDVHLAFEVGLKNGSQVQSGKEALLVTNEPPQQSTIKTLVRKVARYGYRHLLRPLVRPIAFRTRRYLINGFLQEIQHEIRLASAEAAREIQREVKTASKMLLENITLQNDLSSPRFDRIEQYAAASARRIAINCDSGEMLVRTSVGFLLCSTSDHALLACLTDTGDLEIGTRLLIQQYLKPGDVYVDIGANVGIHTLAAAHAMHGQGKIIAFEAFEPTKRMLEKSIWINGFSNLTEIHQAAVSNTVGHQKLFLGTTSGHHSLFALEPSSGSEKNTAEVPLVRLDGIIAPDQRIDLMKIDVEGAELDVIEGGASLIASNPNIGLIVEFASSHLRRTGYTSKQWFIRFEQLGLHFRVINSNTGKLELWPLRELEQAESVNLFFAHEGSSAWSRLS